MRTHSVAVRSPEKTKPGASDTLTLSSCSRVKVQNSVAQMIPIRSIKCSLDYRYTPRIWSLDGARLFARSAVVHLERELERITLHDLRGRDDAGGDRGRRGRHHGKRVLREDSLLPEQHPPQLRDLVLSRSGANAPGGGHQRSAVGRRRSLGLTPSAWGGGHPLELEDAGGGVRVVRRYAFRLRWQLPDALLMNSR